MIWYQLLPSGIDLTQVSMRILIEMQFVFIWQIVSQHLHGMRRRLFNEKVRASTMSAHSVSNLHPASCTTRCKSIGDDYYLKPVGSPVCTLPGIGFHLNALAPISEDVVPYNNQAAGESSNNMSCTVNTRPLIYEHNSQMKVISGNQLVLYSSEVDANIQNDHSSQIMPMNADESGQESPKKKRYVRCMSVQLKYVHSGNHKIF